MSPSIIRCPQCASEVDASATQVCPKCREALPSTERDLDEAVWFYAKDNKKVGPVSLAELRSLLRAGELQPSDMLLKQGEPKWIEADSLADLDESEEESLPDSTNQTLDFDPEATDPDETKADHSASSVDTKSPVPLAHPVKAGVHVPGYTIGDELGRGGMGVVYEATHLALKRRVALKMILAGAHADSEQIDRFRSEAEAVARFQHPNIVQIFDIGELDGLPYCALEFVDGGCLSDRTGPRPIEEAARLTEQLARAMHYAHQRNVVHRDLKPANVLLTAEGQPKVTDFGLAKTLDADSGQTRSGAIMGTPSYMAPEQAAGKIEDISPITDVYALGGILFYLLTGKPPFRGKSQLHTIQDVLKKDPTSPCTLRPEVPVELETICLKCLEKEPDNRYGSALQLAQDLERWQAGEPILARPEGLLGKSLRKLKRYRTQVAVAVVGLVLLGISAYFYDKYTTTQTTSSLLAEIRSGIDAKEWNPQRLRDVEAKIARLSASDPSKADELRSALLTRYRGSLEDILARSRITEQDAREFRANWVPLAKRDAKVAAALEARLEDRLANWNPVISIRNGSDRWQATFDKGSLVAKDGMLFARRGPGTATPVVLSTVPCSGNAEIVAEFDSTWADDPNANVLLYSTGGHSIAAGALAFSPDGQTLASGSSDQTVRLWDFRSGLERHTIDLGNAVRQLVFSSDGKRLFAGTGKGLSILDPETGQILKSVPVPIKGVFALAISPDGKRLATGTDKGVLAFWDTDLKQTVSWQAHSDRINTLAFTPNGAKVVSGSKDTTVRFWNTTTRQADSFQPKHTGPVWSLALSSDGNTLAVTAGVGVQLWDLRSQTEKRLVGLGINSQATNYLAFSPEGLLATGAAIFDLETQFSVMALSSTFRSPSHTVEYSPTGNYLACASTDGIIYIVDARRRRVRSLLGHHGYSFRLIGDPADKAARRRANRNLRLEILRDGARLTSKPIQVSPGKLTLRGRREGDRLLAQVNDLEPVVFEDPLPLAKNLGTFGVSWPETVGLRSLQAQRQSKPKNPSPLEKGDELLAIGRVGDALRAFTEQATTGTSPAVSQEARYKQALCLLELRRDDEANRLLTDLAGEEGKRWPLLAGCKLWLEHLDANRLDDADRMFDSLSTRFRFADLQPALPIETHLNIFEKYRFQTGANFLFAKKKDVERMQRAVEVAEFLDIDPYAQVFLRKDLVRLLVMTGQAEKAFQQCKDALALESRFAESIRLSRTEALLLEYCWLLRNRGQAKQALSELDKRVYSAPGVYQPNAQDVTILHFLLERARILAALDDWDQVQAVLDECKRLGREQPRRLWGSYYSHSSLYLMQGFAHAHRGEDDKAIEAWKKGTKQGWIDAYERPANAPPALSFGGSLPEMYHQIMGSLSSTLSAEDAKTFLDYTLRRIGNPTIQTMVTKVVTIPPSTLQNMWKTERGRQLARHIAFRDLSFRDNVVFPTMLIAYEVVRHGAFGPTITPEQDEVLWTLAEDVQTRVLSEKLSFFDLFNLGMAWKTTFSLTGGWGSVQGKLDEPVRARTSYILGCRYALGSRDSKKAAEYFDIAVKNSKPDSVIQRLAKKGLADLEKKN